jgi:hypothetical protein
MCVLSKQVEIMHTISSRIGGPMLGSGRSVLFGGIVLFLASLPLFSTGTSQVGRNSDPTYQQLRNLTLGNEAVSLNNLDLRRDVATFHLRSGTVCFVTPSRAK